MFKSKAQQAWLEKNKPDVAKEFAGNTPKKTKLPEHVADLAKKPASGITVRTNKLKR